MIIGTEAARMQALDLRSLHWPALGMNEWPNARPMTVDEFARASAGRFAATKYDPGATRPGYFRVARGGSGEWKTELRGALATDSAYARAVLDGVRRYTDWVDIHRRVARNVILQPNVRGVPSDVGIARERGADGRVKALIGVPYGRTVALRARVAHVLQGVSLLPAHSGDGGDSARIANRRGDGTTADNAPLAVRLRYPGEFGDAVSPAAADSAVWRSGFAAARPVLGLYGDFAVEVAVPEQLGRRYVEAATLSRGQGQMLGRVLHLGLGSAPAAALGLRRRYKLAEARRTFVAAVSHELCAQLAHVNALSETLPVGRAESPQQAQRWLRAIHREGRRLSVLTENVLLHARGEGGVCAEPLRQQRDEREPDHARIGRHLQ